MKHIDLDYDLDDLVRMMKAETWSRRWILTLDNNVAIWDYIYPHASRKMDH